MDQMWIFDLEKFVDSLKKIFFFETELNLEA